MARRPSSDNAWSRHLSMKHNSSENLQQKSNAWTKERGIGKFGPAARRWMAAGMQTMWLTGGDVRQLQRVVHCDRYRRYREEFVKLILYEAPTREYASVCLLSTLATRDVGNTRKTSTSTTTFRRTPLTLIHSYWDGFKETPPCIPSWRLL